VSVLLQQALIGMLVAASALYAAWRLATVRVRLRGVEMLAGLPGFRGARWLTALRSRTLAQSTAACGGCSQAASHERRN
jgi:hypothetical protein